MRDHIDMDTRSKPDGSKRVTRSHNKHYVLVKVNGKWIPEHRHVMEQKLGRKLERSEMVHHIDEDTLNNDIDNLQVVTASEHHKIHNPRRYGNKPKTECRYCGALLPYSLGNLYCSARCKFYDKHRTYTCQYCGKRFIGYKLAKPQYCNTDCRNKSRRKKK